MAETACPYCGYSPIAEFEESCPRCQKKFVEDQPVDSVVTRTRMGAPTGAVTARPGPAAAALVVGAAAWLLRVLDVFAQVGDSVFLLVVPVVLIGGATALMAGLGPAKHVPMSMGIVVIAVALLALTDRPVHDGSLVVYGIALVIGTVAEPSMTRLFAGAGTAIFAAIVSLAALLAQPVVHTKGDPGLTDARVGLTWHLPAGWASAERLEGLSAPAPDERRAVLRAKTGDGAQAYLVLDREAADTACDDAFAELGGKVTKLNDVAPAPFARATPVMAVESSQQMRVACSVSNSTMVELVVSAPVPEAIIDATFRVLATGVLVAADPSH